MSKESENTPQIPGALEKRRKAVLYQINLKQQKESYTFDSKLETIKNQLENEKNPEKIKIAIDKYYKSFSKSTPYQKKEDYLVYELKHLELEKQKEIQQPSSEHISQDNKKDTKISEELEYGRKEVLDHINTKRLNEELQLSIKNQLEGEKNPEKIKILIAEYFNNILHTTEDELQKLLKEVISESKLTLKVKDAMLKYIPEDADIATCLAFNYQFERHAEEHDKSKSYLDDYVNLNDKILNLSKIAPNVAESNWEKQAQEVQEELANINKEIKRLSEFPPQCYTKAARKETQEILDNAISQIRYRFSKNLNDKIVKLSQIAPNVAESNWEKQAQEAQEVLANINKEIKRLSEFPPQCYTKAARKGTQKILDDAISQIRDSFSNLDNIDKNKTSFKYFLQRPQDLVLLTNKQKFYDYMKDTKNVMPNHEKIHLLKTMSKNAITNINWNQLKGDSLQKGERKKIVQNAYKKIQDNLKKMGYSQNTSKKFAANLLKTILLQELDREEFYKHENIYKVRTWTWSTKLKEQDDTLGIANKVRENLKKKEAKTSVGQRSAAENDVFTRGFL